MFPRLLLFAAALASAAAQAAQQPTAPLPHPNDPLAPGGLNPMHIPAVRGSYVAGLAARGVDIGARHRRMQANPETGAMPHLHDKFDFIGITDAGFAHLRGVHNLTTYGCRAAVRAAAQAAVAALRG